MWSFFKEIVPTFGFGNEKRDIPPPTKKEESQTNCQDPCHNAFVANQVALLKYWGCVKSSDKDLRLDPNTCHAERAEVYNTYDSYQRCQLLKNRK